MQHTYLESVTIPISVKNSCTNQIVGKNPRIVAQIRTLRKKKQSVETVLPCISTFSALYNSQWLNLYLSTLKNLVKLDHHCLHIRLQKTHHYLQPPRKNEVKVNLLFCLVERHYSIHLRLILLLRLTHRTPNLGQPGRQVWGRTATCTTDLLFIMVTLLTNIACLTIPCFSLMIGSVSIFFRNIIFLEVLLYSDPYQGNFDVN